MESGTISEVKGDEVTGCPVMHEDFSTTRKAGEYWSLAETSGTTKPADP